MRTYIFSALAALTFGLLTLTPANAEKAAWTCMSPAFACGGAPTAKSYRSQEFAGERTYRRQASGKRNRVAKHEDSSRRVARTERKEQQPEKAQAKVELPERKQTPPQAKAAAEQPKDKTAERKVEIREVLSDDLVAVGHGVLLRLRVRLADGFRRALQPECHDGRASHACRSAPRCASPTSATAARSLSPSTTAVRSFAVASSTCRRRRPASSA